jgi:hypothetical protein
VLRIDLVRDGRRVTVLLAGNLVATDLVTLDGFVARHGIPDAISLSAVTNVDGQGIEALRRLRARGVALLEATPLVALSLETSSADVRKAKRDRKSKQ